MWSSGTKNPTYRAISKDCSDQKVNCGKNLLSRKDHIWLLASNNGVSSHFFLLIFQKISFFHNYCGELLCLVSTHLCLLCHFYVVYELFIYFWVEFFSISISKPQWRNHELTKFGPKGLREVENLKIVSRLVGVNWKNECSKPV